MVSDKDLKEVALTRAEYQKIHELLGREPTKLELGIFGVLWSEHCSYKSSKPLLRVLPTESNKVVIGIGENAGVIDLGTGYCIVFKIESHNHPSAVEPYQGAATGVGGILRDVMSMGARPIAILDSLRFGPTSHARSQYLFDQVVAGVGGYGNPFGCPTVGGEIYFEDCYKENPLVNVMCVGIAKTDRIIRGKAYGQDNPVLLVGASTGRDGLHGASFASVELDQEQQARRPAVQIADPFMEKCLLEALSEVIDLHYNDIIGVQDLGAAGLTSSCAEMAHRGGSGIEIEVTKVPQRDVGMTPYEIMLSESQERMLLVVRRGSESQICEHFNKWGLHCSEIGKVTDDGYLTIKEYGRLVTRLRLDDLLDSVPIRSYEAAPKTEVVAHDIELAKIEDVEEASDALLTLLRSDDLRSKRYVFRRYDHQVGINTVIKPGGDAAVLRIKETGQGIAVTTDGNGRYCFLDPYVGAQIAVCEAFRNIVATGSVPIGVTDCLNFGNPENPKVYAQMQLVIAGIAEALRWFQVPVVSGNVSLYNDTGDRPIFPTPVIGAVGLLDDVTKAIGIGFIEEDSYVFMCGETRNELGGSAYLKYIHGLIAGRPPSVDLIEERAAHKFILDLASRGLLLSCHDISDGGLLVALAECCITSGLGVWCPEVHAYPGLRKDALYFGESQGRFIFTCRPRSVPTVQSVANSYHVNITLLGMVRGDRMVIGDDVNLSIKEIAKAYDPTLNV
jgi:phosphoribosylformylglycinamidine synthase II